MNDYDLEKFFHPNIQWKEYDNNEENFDFYYDNDNEKSFIPKIKGTLKIDNNKKYGIYLAGKVTGFTKRYGDWRRDFLERVFHCFTTRIDPQDTQNQWPSPFRISKNFYYCGPFIYGCDHGCSHSNMAHGIGGDCSTLNQSEIFKRCISQIDTCDILIINLESMKSYGSYSELGYAKGQGKTIIGYGYVDKDLWFLYEMCDIYVYDLGGVKGLFEKNEFKEIKKITDILKAKSNEEIKHKINSFGDEDYNAGFSDGIDHGLHNAFEIITKLLIRGNFKKALDYLKYNIEDEMNLKTYDGDDEFKNDLIFGL